MKILVTGAAGLIGTQVVRELLAHGHEVRALDIMPLENDLRAQVEAIYADCTDKLTMLRACDGCEALIHLAVISVAHRMEDQTYYTNVVGTQITLAAAEAMGIRKVALASSNCAYGLLYLEDPVWPQYLPIDEKHPLQPRDYYALSKVLNEETAAAFVRRGDMDIVCIRPTTVLKPITPQRLRWYGWGLRNRKELQYNDYWAYITLEDIARAFRLAIEVSLPGFHIFNAAAADSFTVLDVRDLVREVLPQLEPCNERLAPNQSLYDTTLIREKLGLTTGSWRDMPELVEEAAKVDEPLA